MVYLAWILVNGAWMDHGAWCIVYGTWCMVSSIQSPPQQEGGRVVDSQEVNPPDQPQVQQLTRTNFIGHTDYSASKGHTD